MKRIPVLIWLLLLFAFLKAPKVLATDTVVVLDGDDQQTLTLSADQIESVDLYRKNLSLNGRLVEELEREDKNYISEMGLRFNLRSDGPVTINNKKYESIYFTVDYVSKDKDKVDILHRDYSEIDNLELKARFAFRTSDSLLSSIDEKTHQVFIYRTNFSSQESAELYQEILEISENKNGTIFHSQKNNSAINIYTAMDKIIRRHRDYGNIYIERPRGQTGGLRRLERRKNREARHNAYQVEHNVKIRRLVAKQDWRLRNLLHESCALEQTNGNVRCLQSTIFDKSFTTLNKNGEEFDYFISSLKSLRDRSHALMKKIDNVYYNIDQMNLEYLHKGVEVELDKMAVDIITHDYDLLRLRRNLKASKYVERFSELDALISFTRLEYWGHLITHLKKDYRYLRFFEEGARNKEYARNFIRGGIEGMIEAYDDLQKFDSDNYAILSVMTPIRENLSFTSKDLKKVKNMMITTLEEVGNTTGDVLVNVLGQIFKKRSWVPKIRISTNFRKNYLTKYRERTFEKLFSPGGMEPGDIIIEKDMMANNDVLIPGYWLHASVYLGTIPWFKQVGLWEDPEFANIRWEIEEYKRNPKRQEYMRKKLKMDMAFDEIPWFMESDRPGVLVHPMQKFVLTDGMAVLRPTKNWEIEDIKKTIRRANYYTYFPYDYIHNVRNKFSVTCSKFVLKTFDQITFPVSKNLSYVTHSPDQTGSPVSLDVNRPELGELKLIIFFDAENEGQIAFDRRDKATWEKGYEQYLRVTLGKNYKK